MIALYGTPYVRTLHNFCACFLKNRIPTAAILMMMNNIVFMIHLSSRLSKYKYTQEIIGLTSRGYSSSQISKMTDLKEKYSAKCFGGYQKIFAHNSEATNCEMRFAIFLPPQATSTKLPVIYFLSGLTMDHRTFADKSGAQRYASEQGVILVAPDSSPPAIGIPGENDKWYYGSKASYYIDATEEPWCKHYKMYSYLTKELRNIINDNFPVLVDKQSIIGHSIGGYGAFVLTVRNPDWFVSTSALAPICDPVMPVSGPSVEALGLYLGEGKTRWADWDIIRLLENYNGPPLRFHIDQGLADEYLADVNTDRLLEACKKASIPVTYNEHDGYDHQYFFVKTFIEDHIKYHMQFLNSAESHL